jgi:hypothetical protein
MNQLQQKVKGFIRALPVYVSVLSPFVAHGAGGAIQPFVDIMCRVMYYIWVLALTVGVIYILIAAFKYMTAEGDASKVSEAHQTVLYAVIGITVAVGNLVGGATVPNSCGG